MFRSRVGAVADSEVGLPGSSPLSSRPELEKSRWPKTVAEQMIALNKAKPRHSGLVAWTLSSAMWLYVLGIGEQVP